MGIPVMDHQRQVELLGQFEDRAAGDAGQDRAGQCRGDQSAVLHHEEDIHPAELIDIRVRGGVEEDGLVAAVLCALDLTGER